MMTEVEFQGAVQDLANALNRAMMRNKRIAALLRTMYRGGYVVLMASDLTIIYEKMRTPPTDAEVETAFPGIEDASSAVDTTGTIDPRIIKLGDLHFLSSMGIVLPSEDKNV